MRLAEKIKTLENKIEANKAKCKLDIEIGKISIFSSGNLDRCGYLNCQGLAPKPLVFIYYLLHLFNLYLKLTI